MSKILPSLVFLVVVLFCQTVLPGAVAAELAGNPGNSGPYLSRADIEAARIAVGLGSLDDIVYEPTGGSKDRDFNARTDGPVYAIMECGGDLYVAGDFTRLNYSDIHEWRGMAHLNNIARYDGQQWHRVGSGTDGPIYALAKVYDEEYNVWLVVAAGDFEVAGGFSTHNLAAWNGERWSTNSTDIGSPLGPIYALHAVSEGNSLGANYLVGGDALGNLLRVDLGYPEGELMRHTLTCDQFYGRLDEAITSLYVESDPPFLWEGVVGGYFLGRDIYDFVFNHIVSINMDFGYLQLQALGPGLAGNVFAIEMYEYNDCWVGGEFDSTDNGAPALYLADCNFGGCDGVDEPGGPNGPIHALAWSGEELVVGGHFTYPRVGIARFRDSEWISLFGDGVPSDETLLSVVYALEFFDGYIVAGGAFPGFLKYLQGSTSYVPENEPVATGPTIVAVTPNPANPQTRVRFLLTESAHAELTILDSRGHRVARLHDAVLPAGEHDIGWDGRDNRGRSVASGVYLVQLVASGQITMQKVAVLK